MMRKINGLHDDSAASTDMPEGVFLAQVQRAFFTPHAAKPFYTIRFSILEPREAAGKSVAGRLYCSPRALWKLAWFLRDFGYDPELLDRDEVDDKRLIGLRGVLRVSKSAVNGRTFSSLDAFAPAEAWSESQVESGAA